MAVDPSSMTMPRPPMTCSPGVIRVACVVTRAVNVIRPIANLDRYGARITRIIRSTVPTIIGSVIARISTVIPFTAYCAEHGET